MKRHYSSWSRDIVSPGNAETAFLSLWDAEKYVSVCRNGISQNAETAICVTQGRNLLFYFYRLENLSLKSAILDRFTFKPIQNKQISCFEKKFSSKVPTPCVTVFGSINVDNLLASVPTALQTRISDEIGRNPQSWNHWVQDLSILKTVFALKSAR